jgi:hypothetical protein
VVLIAVIASPAGVTAAALPARRAASTYSTPSPKTNHNTDRQDRAEKSVSVLLLPGTSSVQCERHGSIL